MTRWTGLFSIALLLALAAGGAVAEQAQEAEGSANPVVEMKTNLGTVEIELWPDKAPITVKNFLDYVDKDFYDGTVFHRVIPGFMIQGGGMDAGLREKKTGPPIKNEADNGLKNVTGTIAMARTAVVDSATSQFFINTVDNVALDHRGAGPKFGYAVFGRVVSGMDVVEKIEAGPTTKRPPFADVPAETITIESIERK